ncbi:MAG: ZIP family metal transporter [Candidatus Pacearchaeota archaeon]
MVLNEIWFYALGSVILVSSISLLGILTLNINEKKLEKILIYIIAFSAGTLIGDAFIHLLPEIVERQGFTLLISSYILIGIGFSFCIEKFIHWRHCHHPTSKKHLHPLTTMNLVGDGVHNFLDGIIIVASYIVSIPVGIATTLAVALHEIPQEISEYGVLLYGGYTKNKALLANFLISLTAIFGALLTLVLSFKSEGLINFLIPFAAGNFIYIATADLIPELHKKSMFKESILQLILFILGILIMAALLLLE